jgi:hypothetical protein
MDRQLKKPMMRWILAPRRWNALVRLRVGLSDSGIGLELDRTLIKIKAKTPKARVAGES